MNIIIENVRIEDCLRQGFRSSDSTKSIVTLFLCVRSIIMKSRYCSKLIFAWRVRRAGSDSIEELAQLRNLKVRYCLLDVVEISLGHGSGF